MNAKAEALRAALLGFERKMWIVEVRGQTFGLREPTGIEQQEYADIATGIAATTGTQNAAAYRSMIWILARTLCEPESRELLFQPGDLGETALANQVPGDVIRELFAGLMERIKEQKTSLGKGSGAIPASSSG